MAKQKTKLSNHIRAFRSLSPEITQAELARRVGCTRQTIIALEANKYVPSLALAFRIARVFQKTIEEVFSLNEP